MSNLSSTSPYVKRRTLYKPAMMQFDGSTGYYSGASATSGNKFSAVLRFKRETFADSGREALLNIRTASNNRLVVWINSSNYSVTDEQNKITIYSQNSSDATALILVSSSDFTDGNEHSLLVSYDGDNGTAILEIDGADEINTGATNHTITTATLATTSGSHYIGARSGITDYIDGSLGFVGYADAYLTTYSDFFDSNDNPIKQDETAWANSGWGSQPLLWNEHGFMVDNRGSASDMTKSGTVDIADAEEFLNG